MKEVTNALDWDSCPACKASWDGGSILETFVEKRASGDPYYKDMSDQELIQTVRDNYGDVSARWKRSIGIEIWGSYDGVLYVQCPDCKATFHRFSGERQNLEYDGPKRLGEDPSS